MNVTTTSMLDYLFFYSCISLKSWSVRPLIKLHDLSLNRCKTGWILSSVIFGLFSTKGT